MKRVLLALLFVLLPSIVRAQTSDISPATSGGTTLGAVQPFGAVTCGALTAASFSGPLNGANLINASVTNAKLASATITISGTSCTLGSTCSVSGGQPVPSGNGFVVNNAGA